MGLYHGNSKGRPEQERFTRVDHVRSSATKSASLNRGVASAWNPITVVEVPEWAADMARDYGNAIAGVIHSGRDQFIDLHGARRLRIMRVGLMAKCTVLRRGTPVKSFEAYLVADGLCRVRKSWDVHTDVSARHATRGE